ncbi:CLUMA_CG019965, isoform A [Clunio marinus]|uniref:CLUMA_CG019965, isoform A n=1 Tax=Clunio marinus TaxID=568069 RepID=A0A1J1J656_9DIPT|nr:CLUMA_CG019965, isoform A [Clunio marinus]
MASIEAINYDLFKEHNQKETYVRLNPSGYTLTLLLIKNFSASKNLSHQKIILKALLKPALCLNYPYVEKLFKTYGSQTSTLGAELLRIYMWVHNDQFINKFGVVYPNTMQFGNSFEVASLAYSMHTKFFQVAIENFIAYGEISVGNSNTKSYNTILMSNLENLHENVRPLLLNLFNQMMKFFFPYEIEIDSESKSEICKIFNPTKPRNNEIIDDILKLPWTNRNKYSLLSIIIATNIEILLSNKNFVKDNFLKGIFVALTFHHLLASSANLVKALHKHEFFQDDFIKILSGFLWKGEDKEIGNIVKYWFSGFDQQFVNKFYDEISKDGKFLNIPTTSLKFHRLLVLRNAFRGFMKNPELDKSISEFAFVIEEMPIKIEIFSILIDRIYTEKNESQQKENVFILLKFIRTNMTTKDSNFVDHHIMRKLPEFFNFLANKKIRELEFQRKAFGIIKQDIFSHGINLNFYESTMFSLKLLEVILKQYFSTSQSGLSKNTNYKENSKFGIYLKQNEIWDLLSKEIIDKLFDLVYLSDESDISNTAQNILVEYFIKSSSDDCFSVFQEIFHSKKELYGMEIGDFECKRKLYVLDIEEEFRLGNVGIDNLRTSPSKILKQWKDFKSDSNPVLSMKTGNHLYNFIDEINYTFSRLESTEELTNKLMTTLDCIQEITKKFLDLINDTDETTTFESLDQRLDDLIRKSSTESLDLKPKLLLFIWYTLRSCSEISFTFTKLVADSEFNNLLKSRVIDICIDINIQILTKCCHKGAIESASEAIGKITKIVSQKFLNFCNRNNPEAVVYQKTLIKLKHKIYCGERVTNEDIRCNRGHILMAQAIIKNHPAFVKFVIESLIALVEIQNASDELKFPSPLKVGFSDLCQEETLNNTTYIVLLLEMFSNFEFRNTYKLCPEMGSLREKFEELMSHREEKVRFLAGKCYALWQEVDLKMLQQIKDWLLFIFNADGNKVHSTVNCIKIMIERYESCVKFIDDSFDIATFKESCREIIQNAFDSAFPFVGATNFFIRYHILDFLMFLGFTFSDVVVQSLMTESNLKNHFGYQIWKEKIQEIQMKSENYQKE